MCRFSKTRCGLREGLRQGGQGITRHRGEHHLNTVKRSPDVQNENWLNPIARKRSTKTLCSSLSIEGRLPKLDVAGSSPVSRSIFSMTYRDGSCFVLHLCSVYFSIVANTLKTRVLFMSHRAPVRGVPRRIRHSRDFIHFQPAF
jgi:hypothetical protein